ncbi:MAG: glutathione S-transferase family protein [Alphaproteobacteria bacterium]
MIKLYQFPSAFGLPNASPFCMKTEVMLKMLELPYEIVPTSNPKVGPKGKLPFIEDEDGARVADSEIIRQHLEKKTGRDLDQGLSAEERATAHAFARMLEERTYFIMLQNRWDDEKNWPIVRKTFFSDMPVLIRNWTFGKMQKRMRAALYYQGTGRHGPDEIAAFGKADIKAASTFLGDKKFFMGEQPTSVDATAYPFLIGFAIEPFPSPVQDEIRKHPNLMGYMDRMRRKFYPQ